MPHRHRYSDFSLGTSGTKLKHLWQRPSLVWHENLCASGFGDFLLCRSSTALSGWMGAFSGQTCLIGLKSGLSLGHSRTSTELSLCQSCTVLAPSCGSWSCWKVNLRPRSLASGYAFHYGSLCAIFHSAFPQPWTECLFLMQTHTQHEKNGVYACTV